MAPFNSLYILPLANFLAQFGKVVQQNFMEKTSKTAFHQMNLLAMLLGNQVLKKLANESTSGFTPNRQNFLANFILRGNLESDSTGSLWWAHPSYLNGGT